MLRGGGPPAVRRAGHGTVPAAGRGRGAAVRVAVPAPAGGRGGGAGGAAPGGGHWPVCRRPTPSLRPGLEST